MLYEVITRVHAANGLAQSLTGGLENFIAEGVAKFVVAGFEAIEIDEEQGKALAVSFGQSYNFV